MNKSVLWSALALPVAAPVTASPKTAPRPAKSGAKLPARARYAISTREDLPAGTLLVVTQDGNNAPTPNAPAPPGGAAPKVKTSAPIPPVTRVRLAQTAPVTPTTPIAPAVNAPVASPEGTSDPRVPAPDDAVAATTAEPTETVIKVVTERSDSQIGKADAASEGVVGPKQLERRPILRPGDILETVPGVIISQHSGSGKANQYYLRGFNLDHGTDIAISVDGMPANPRTRAGLHRPQLSVSRTGVGTALSQRRL